MTTTTTTTTTVEQLESYARQVSTLMIEGNGGLFALCLNTLSPNYGNLMFKHEATGTWVKQRAASEFEKAMAEKTVADFKLKIAQAESPAAPDVPTTPAV